MIILFFEGVLGIANWEQIETTGTVTRRNQHTAVLLKKEGKPLMIVFGGNDWRTGVLGDLAIYDFGSKSWSQPKISGPSPTARRKHTAVAISDSTMLLFGGIDTSHQVVNDLWKFDILTNTWTKIQTSKSPAPRHSHTAVLYEGSMIIFGGLGASSFLGDVWKYSAETNTWQEVNNGKNGGPIPRSAASAVIEGNYMYIFGGIQFFGGYDGYLNDLAKYDLKSNQWISTKASGQPPTARASHTSVVLNGQIYIIGGYDLIYLYDIVKLDPKNLKWEGEVAEENPPFGITAQSAVVHEGDIYVFGGTTGDYEADPLSSLYRITID